MKYLLFGDVHDRDLSELENALNFHKIDVLVCTGDFDSPRSIKQFMELEKKYISEGKMVYLVPGNHDYALLYNEPIMSRQMLDTGMRMNDYFKELSKDREIYKYLENIVDIMAVSAKKHIKKFYLDELQYSRTFSTVTIHGGYDGSLSGYYGCPEGLRELWFRMPFIEDYQKNFEKMKIQGDRIMMRGHDHKQEYVSYLETSNQIVRYIPRMHGSDYLLKPDRLHVINPGAFVDGFYSIIDTDEEKYPLLKFYNL